NPDARIDAAWWHQHIAQAINRRSSLEKVSNAYRLVHAEGDGLPSLVCDRYDRYIVVQIMSAGLESERDHIVNALRDLTQCEGILARNDVPLRSKEGLRNEVVQLYGTVPREVEVHEHGVRYIAAP